MAPPTYPVIPETLLIISLKMYFSPARTIDYLKELIEVENHVLLPQNQHKILVALMPDFLSIYPCAHLIRGRFPEIRAAPHGDTTTDPNSSDSVPAEDKHVPPPFMLGAQDCFWQEKGPFTGEVSPLHLRQLGVSLVEVGHAERRVLLGETDEMVAKKTAAVSRCGMIPVVCVGEVHGPGPVSLAVQECEGQVRAALEAIDEAAPIIFAYEPVWAIGKHHPAGLAHVEGVVSGLREIVGERKGMVKFIYGGSAQPGIWSDEEFKKTVDGLFMGRFAHHVDGVRLVIREIEEGPEGLM